MKVKGAVMNAYWRKTFFIIWSGQAISLLSSAVVQFSIIWWITNKTESAIVLSSATLVGLLPQVLCTPFAGVFADRWNRKSVMIMADLLVAVSSLVLAMLFLYGEPHTMQIYIILALRAIGFSFHFPAFQASIPMIVPVEQLARTAGFNQALQSVVKIAGPLLGAIVLNVWSISGAMMLDVIGAIIANMMLLFVSIPQPASIQKTVHKNAIFGEMYLGFKALSEARGLFILTVVSAVSIFIYIPVSSMIPLIVIKHFHGDAWHIGVVRMFYGSGMLLGSIILGIWGGPKKKIYLINSAIISMGIDFIIMGSLPSNRFAWLIIAAAFLGLAIPMFNGPFYAILQTQIESSMQGRILSFVNGIMHIATPLGLILAGPVADKLGVNILFVFSGFFISTIGTGCFFIPSIIHIEGNIISN